MSRRSALRLRSVPRIALAFALGPWAGLTAMTILEVLVPPSGGVGQENNVWEGLVIYIGLLGFGGAACLIVEFVIVTPLLLGFQRYRWRWLNGWTGAVIGFAIGFLPSLALAFLDATDATPVTPAVWLQRLESAGLFGSVGLVAAIVFRLIAVQTDAAASTNEPRAAAHGRESVPQ